MWWLFVQVLTLDVVVDCSAWHARQQVPRNHMPAAALQQQEQEQTLQRKGLHDTAQHVASTLWCVSSCTLQVVCGMYLRHSVLAHSCNPSPPAPPVPAACQAKGLFQKLGVPAKVWELDDMGEQQHNLCRQHPHPATAGGSSV
jgi:hypothetical protein